MLVAVVLAVGLALATSSFHYATLRWLSGGMARIALQPGRRVLCIVFVVLLAHVGEVVLYAAAYGFSSRVLDLGRFGGLAVERPLDFLYFSIVTYTSLGLGDVFPGGHLRFIAGVEALNSLLLIAWSGSFIYLAMGRLWPWQRCAEPADRRAGDRRSRKGDQE
ncbi:potassium channel family protein [Tistlia consotensis]|nr:potassium channel family protein [Tistlia consotensis]